MRWAKAVGDVVLSGWGDDIAEGYIIGLLNEVTPELLYSYIEENKDLDVGSIDGKIPAQIINKLDETWVMGKLRKHRPDLASLLVNYPNGLPWVKRQIDRVKGTLTTKFSSVKIETNEADKPPE